MRSSDEEPLPKYLAQDERGDEGMRIVARIVADDLRWVFRDQTRRDFGIDCLIEVVDEKRQATGRLIAAQIKCGDSYFRDTTSAGVVYRGEPKHLNYWLRHSLPVIVILCRPGGSDCYYAPITSGAVRRTDAGWTTEVPYTQRFDASASAALRRLGDAPQRADVIELALLRFLVERWGDRLRIATVIESPRDWHWYPYLIEVRGDTGGLFGVQFIDTAMRPLSVEVLAEEIKWLEWNSRQVGGGLRLMLFLVGNEPADTRLSPEAENYVGEHSAVQAHRMIYRPSDTFALTEIDHAEQGISTGLATTATLRGRGRSDRRESWVWLRGLASSPWRASEVRHTRRALLADV